MHVFRGVPASAGVASGPWRRYRPEPLPEGGRIGPEAAAGELERFRSAAEAAAQELEAIAEATAARGHRDEAGIFEAQAAMARDPALAAGVEER
ncbi:MAG TPA: phosphoenolpyruvate-utilizing N-terminal domain-containing protein, partial [Candidatus Limnocylindrales bacterium]|nr:phosphoenolpyruvate-utilizing N-terminal domain-containing protein [Candidatus Limnocylindrales bacterium]